MEKHLKPPDISEGVTAIVKKFKSKQKVTIKTPSSPVLIGFLLASIAHYSEQINSPVLLVTQDEFSQLNLVTYAKKWTKHLKSKILIHTNTSSVTIKDVQNNKPIFVILTQEQMNEQLPKPELFEKYIINLKPKQKISREMLLKKLIESGYTKERTANEPGLVASRGSVVDICPNYTGSGIRIDFDDQIIDTIKSFELGKDNTKNLESTKILPFNLDHLDKKATLYDYNPELKRIIFDSFPPKPDVMLQLTHHNISILTKIIIPEEREEKKPKANFIKKLQNGDYVVHLDHGIARFEGIVQQNVDNIMREYFKLAYLGGDTLFLPVTAAEKMERYIGDPNPALSRLSGPGWQKIMRKASLDTLHHARELLNTQAKRQLAHAPVIPNAVKMQQQLAKSFPFDETKDQKEVIKTIYHDLEQDMPMDRLVCGDVGFGKTEVAIRAAAKAALSGHQVAVLSPTTILTQQHLDTFIDRLKEFPIVVEGLSRFQSKKDQAQTLEKLEKGKVDIVIGTHRLLSGDVKFHNLGLIIVDEEQRFGVAHKEQLKKLRAQAHVLTLTATPIPRTLHLGLSGVRAVSTITTPPSGRKPIETIIEPHNQKHVQSAIEKELARRGQVYYLYNNVETMAVKTQELQALMPKVKFGVLHGQLPEGDIASVMHKFDKKEIDVLVCSTIIENGLDLPNVNTLIVDNAVQFGLSQLHQIRGRIGRGNRQAYAYFFYKRAKLTGEAEKRLQALEEAKDLGSGFDLAQRDMEIRGVGNVLGKAQHGHVKSIGLGLYVRLLNSAVAEIKSGEPSEVLADISVDLPIEARIPQFFENNKEKRIELYHQWALLETIDELQKAKDDLAKEGAVPPTIENLFYILKLKILGRSVGIISIDTTFASANSSEQVIILKTDSPIEPKLFSKMLDNCQHWQYSVEELKVAKKDLGSDWMKKLEQCIKMLVNN